MESWNQEVIWCCRDNDVILVTARKRRLQRLCFHTCLSSCSQGVVVSQHALQVCRPIPRGEVEGSGLGVFPGPHPGGCLQAHTRGEYPSMHWGRHPPPADSYCCGRYASYWNAFLFLHNFEMNHITQINKKYLKIRTTLHLRNHWQPLCLLPSTATQGRIHCE